MKASRVLVMEDDFMVGALLGELLTDMGHTVCATEATEAGAVGAAARCHPDLMIVDIRLGSGSGVRATDAILRGGSVPHVFVSGSIAALVADRPGAVAIQKPFRAAELENAIQRALSTGQGP